MKYLLAIGLFFTAACNGDDKKVDAPVTAADNGKELFVANCSICHKQDADYVGPALKNVSSRWASKTLLYDFIKNSADVIPRNEYAKQLFLKHKESPMPAFTQLSDADIDAILTYCNQ